MVSAGNFPFAVHANGLGGLGALAKRFAGLCARAIPTTWEQRMAAEARRDMMKTTLSK